MQNKLAGIQYVGESGITQSCKKAVIQLLHAGERVEEVKILTLESQHSNAHAFLLMLEFEIPILIKDGFASGYTGEGPRGYGFVLNLLSQYTDNINEYIVSEGVFERISDSALTENDLEDIARLRRVLPARWYDYVPLRTPKEHVFSEFPLSLPMALIDSRLIDIALGFDSNPDNAILNGYRKIESIVRKRTGLTKESSTKLFSKAFQGDDSVLSWDNLDPGESKGRASLFTSVFMAYRNNRAHQEPQHDISADIREFLLINQLFILESEATVRECQGQEKSNA